MDCHPARSVPTRRGHRSRFHRSRTLLVRPKSRMVPDVTVTGSAAAMLPTGRTRATARHSKDLMVLPLSPTDHDVRAALNTKRRVPRSLYAAASSDRPKQTSRLIRRTLDPDRCTNRIRMHLEPPYMATSPRELFGEGTTLKVHHELSGKSHPNLNGSQTSYFCSPPWPSPNESHSTWKAAGTRRVGRLTARDRPPESPHSGGSACRAAEGVTASVQDIFMAAP